MTQLGTLVRLRSGTMDPCTITKEAHEQAIKDWLCTGCVFPRPGWREIDLHIEEDDPGPIPLTVATGCGVSLARMDFLMNVLGPERLRADFLLGRVLREDGSLIDGWATFQGRRKIIVRGTEHVAFRHCDVCGRRVYFAMGKHYIAPPPPDDAWAYETSGGLALPATDVSKWGKLRGVAVETLPILDKGLDGIEELDAPGLV